MSRLFIGIFIPKELKERILFFQNRIKSLNTSCKFVEPENLHISLSFLGEVDDKKIKNIEDKLDNICKNFQKFEIRVDGLKIIPSEKYIRVLALDVASGGNLEKLLVEIKKSIGGDVKPPHLTLCRINSVIDNKEKFASDLKKIDWSVGNFTILEVSLVKSVVTRSGPVYTSLHNCSL